MTAKSKQKLIIKGNNIVLIAIHLTKKFVYNAISARSPEPDPIPEPPPSNPLPEPPPSNPIPEPPPSNPGWRFSDNYLARLVNTF